MAGLQDVHVAFRLPQSLVDRLDALALAAVKDPTFAATGRAGRSAMIRLALVHGVEALERKYADAAPKATPKRK